MNLLPVEKAAEIIQQEKRDFGIETILLEEALGRVLAEDIPADRDFPPFHRVTMDGFALSSSAYVEGRRSFVIYDTQYAGEAQKSLPNTSYCIEVMTGACLPEGCDSVIRIEECTINDGKLSLPNGVEILKNIHHKGSDKKKGELLLKAGHLLKASDIAVLATVGKATVLVKKMPRVAILTSGDELVAVEAVPLPSQIRSSNVFALKDILRSYCSEINTFHLPDDLVAIKEQLTKVFQSFDAIILSGGVSAGKKDYVPQALEELSTLKLFHKVKQRPGKPMWFGKRDRIVLFALPGNPVSTFMCAVRYVVPWLKESLGIPLGKEKAILQENVLFEPELTFLLQVKVQNENGMQLAYPVPANGSGDLASLSQANAFIELPHREDKTYKKGEVFTVWYF